LQVACIYIGECAHEQHPRRTLPNADPNFKIKIEISYVCVYSSVQLDKRRVEKELTNTARDYGKERKAAALYVL